MQVFRCLKVNDGIIALVQVNNADEINELGNISKEDIKIELTEFGIILKARDIALPIPLALLEWLISQKQCFVAFYPISLESFVSEPIISLELSKEELREAKGAYNFWKKSQENKKEEVIKGG
ncbi:MAG: hypothetical protein D6828_04165 [Nitrospirae bacterium]|nr:MAG: hypothetical protein D6828_04165 [Nitrospirota bacterium]